MPETDSNIPDNSSPLSGVTVPSVNTPEGGSAPHVSFPPPEPTTSAGPVPASPAASVFAPGPAMPSPQTAPADYRVPPPQKPPGNIKKTMLAAGIVLVIISIGGGLAYAISASVKKDNPVKSEPVKTADLNKGGKNTILPVKEDLSKYNKDSDSDGYPDFVETALGLNPSASEIDRCMSGNCGDASLTNTAPKQKNVMIILDASGSMGLKIGNTLKMDAAKNAVKNYVTQAAANGISMGLMVYGHKGSNSTADKAKSCAGADQLAAIGNLTPGNVDTYLAVIKATGWTPMGLAIRNATASFTSKTGQHNEIILVTDGDETCNSDPVGAARTANSSAAKIMVNVIGFAVKSNEQATLASIASAGGGSFSVASTSDELVRKLNDLYENAKKLSAELSCKADANIAFMNCYSETNRKVYEYVSGLKSKYYKKEITKNEMDKLTEIAELVWDLGRKARDQSAEQFNAEAKRKSQELYGK